MVKVDLRLGDCLEILPTLAAGSVDAVITDPPYPCIKRDYGYWTETEWWKLIVEGVIPEVRRILKPTGSAVFILQPNSEHVGQMRGWLWEFMAWVCHEWNMVQDVWWLKLTGPPWVGATNHGLMRQSLAACAWCGPPDCYRNQSLILLPPSTDLIERLGRENAEGKLSDRRDYLPSGHSVNRKQFYRSLMEKGGVTPYNVLIPTHDYAQTSPGANGHDAGTESSLIDWWLRYIVPPGGVVVDPFLGSGTTAVAAIKQGKSCIGCDKVPNYIAIAEKRIREAQLQMTMELGV